MRPAAAAILLAITACSAAPSAPSAPPAPPPPSPFLSSSATAMHVDHGALIRDADAAATATCPPPLAAPAASARLRVVHDDQVSALRLVRAAYDLDGRAAAARGSNG